MKIAHLYSCLLLLIVLVACNEQSTPLLDENGEPVIHFPDFEQFPEQQFNEIQLGEKSEEVVHQLTQLGFASVYESGANRLERAADSTIFYVGNQQNLSAFKLVLQSKFYLSHSAALYAKFSKLADTSLGNEQFAVFTYLQTDHPFKLTWFGQPRYIRLNYLELASHH